MDLGFSGILFTYDNGQHGGRNVRVRLGRTCVDEAWSDLFPTTQVMHLASSWSDHGPLLVRLSQVDPKRARGTSRYEIMWETHPALAAMVEQTWKNRRPVGNLGAVRDALNCRR
jgi:hypothetical protein